MFRVLRKIRAYQLAAFGIAIGSWLLVASSAAAQISLLPVIPYDNLPPWRTIVPDFERGFANLRNAGGFPIRVAAPVRTISPQIIERAFSGAGGGTVAFGFGAHSSPGLEGWSHIPGVTRAGVVRNVAETARRYGAHGLIIDGSCGGGTCVQVWDRLPDDLKPYATVITSGGRTQEGFFPSTKTHRVDAFLNVVTKNPRFDLNGDGDLSVEELIKARDFLSQNGYPRFQTISFGASDFKRSLFSKKPGGGSSPPNQQKPNTNVKAVCANLQQDRVRAEIPIFEGTHHSSFPAPNGSVTILDPKWEAALVNQQELLMLQALEYTVQNKMPKFTEWQKAFIEYIRTKEVARFNAGSPAEGLIGGGGTTAARSQISEAQYHFVNVQGEDTKDCPKDSSGNPQPGPAYESQRSVPPIAPPSPPDNRGNDFRDFDRGRNDFGPGGGGGGPGGNSPFAQLLPALLQRSLLQSLLQQQRNGGTTPARPTPRPSPTASSNPVVCAQNYDPVCGVDGKTYTNRCSAEQQAKVAVAHTGACMAASQTSGSTAAGLVQSLLQGGVPGSLLMQIIRGVVGLLLSVFQT